MSDYRFLVHTDPSGTTVFRGRLYQLPSDSDTWLWYWDGDLLVAVYDDQRNYTSPTTGEDTERVEFALRMAREYDQDVDQMLIRLARRIEGNWDARFITVPIDRGVSLYVLSHDGDPDGTWRDEIEAVYHGDIYRVECEEYNAFTESWQHADDCAEWYGDAAEREFTKEFPLAEFPAQMFIEASA